MPHLPFLPRNRGGSFAAGPAAPVGASTVTRQDDLMHWWKCDETSGTEAADSGPDASGNGLTERPLTLANGAAFASGGRDGYAIDFDGSDDVASTADEVIADAAIRGTNNAYTISMWFKPSGITAYYDGVGGLMNGIKGAFLLVQDDLFLAYHNDSGGDWDEAASAVVTISDDSWYLYTQTWDGSTATAYLNAVSKGTLSESTFLAGPYEMDVGWWHTHGSFNGLIDDVRLYDVALTAGEVGDIWNSGSGDLP